MKSLFFVALAFSCLSCFSKGKENVRTCRIIFLERPEGAPEEVHLFDGTSSRKVSLPSMNFSEVITLPSGDLELGMTKDPVPKSGDLPPDAPTVKVPAEINDFFLIVVSDPENEILPLRMLSVDAGVERPEPGQTLWINLTKYTIVGNLGRTSLLVAPGERVIGKAPLPESGYYKVHFTYQRAEGDEFLPIMRKSWWLDASSRNLGFITDSGGRLPRIFTFRDQRAADPAGQDE